MPMGHNPNTITSANSVLMMKCEGVYDNQVQITGFQADNAAIFGDSSIGETRMGVDGKQSIGYTPHETQFSIYLEANSPAISYFENIRKDFNENMEARFIEFYLTIPSIKKRFHGKGGMISLTGGASAKKLLEGSAYTFNMVFNGGEDI